MPCQSTRSISLDNTIKQKRVTVRGSINVYISFGHNEASAIVTGPELEVSRIVVSERDGLICIGEKGTGCFVPMRGGRSVVQTAQGRNIFQVSGNNTGRIQVFNGCRIKTVIGGDFVSGGESLSACESLSVKVELYSMSELVVSGPGDIEIDGIREDAFSLVSAGTGDIHFTPGQVGSFTMKCSGMGDIDGTNLTTQDMVLTCSGMGDIDIQAPKNRLVLTKSGMGDVDIHGQTKEVIQTISGLGQVTFS